MQKKVIEIRLNAYAPINDNICIDSTDQDQVYEIKFHGKPVNKFPLKNSNIENCLLYTSPSPRDRQKSRMPSSA